MVPEEKINKWLSGNPRAESALREAGLFEVLLSDERFDFPSHELMRFVDVVGSTVDELYCSAFLIPIRHEMKSILEVFTLMQAVPLFHSYNTQNYPYSGTYTDCARLVSILSHRPIPSDFSWPNIPSDGIEIIRSIYFSTGSCDDVVKFNDYLFESRCVSNRRFIKDYNLKEKAR